MISASQNDFYRLESLWIIMKREEKSGKLKKGDYSIEVEELSAHLGSLRKKLHALKAHIYEVQTPTSNDGDEWLTEDELKTEIET